MPVWRMHTPPPQRPARRGRIAGVVIVALALATLAAIATRAQAATEPLPVVPHVDLSRYAGTWYEVARLPNYFQRKCASRVTADYALKADGQVTVVNQCIDGDGERIQSEGVARRVTASNDTLAPTGDAGRLEVRFLPNWLSWVPFAWGDYAIIGLDAQYQSALVGTPNREYLWVLSRRPDLPQAQLDQWLAKARELGFPVERVTRTPQVMGATPVAATSLVEPIDKPAR